MVNNDEREKKIVVSTRVGQQSGVIDHPLFSFDLICCSSNCLPLLSFLVAGSNNYQIALAAGHRPPFTGLSAFC
jgi:hypothetical protein